MKNYLRILIVLIALSPLLLFFSHLCPVEGIVPFLGRFHPVVLHMPVAIIMLTAMLEAIYVFSFRRWKLHSEFPLFLGASSAVAAMTLGVLLMQGESMEGDLVMGHLRWGIATTVLVVIALIMRLWPSFDERRRIRYTYRFVLFAACGVLTWASHQGASITHGEDYLTAHSPWRTEAVSEADLEIFQGLSLPFEAREIYEHLIVPVFHGKCYECHKSRSFKGGLVMDTYEGLLKGGETGPAIVPGDLKASLSIKRIHLPIAEEDHMPPANEPQLSDQEVAIIEWWIEHGAPSDKLISALKPDEKMGTAIEEVTAGLIETSKVSDYVFEEAHSLSHEEVEALRAPFAEAMAVLEKKYPGMVRYADNQGASVSVTCFHKSWNDEDLLALAPLAAQITTLVLPENRLTPAVLPTLNKMTALKTLNFKGSEVNDVFVQGLVLPQLKSLNLFQTKITDVSLEALASFQNLSKVYLRGNDVSVQALDALREKLPGCEVVGAREPATP